MAERTPRLVRLPSGDWIDPAIIVGIKHFPPSVVAGRRILPSVVVITSRGTVFEHNFPGADEAQAFCDDLAQKVNDA
jgi:hypothetical protein